MAKPLPLNHPLWGLQQCVNLGMAVIPMWGIHTDWPDLGQNSCACPNPDCGANAGKHPRIAWGQYFAPPRWSEVEEWLDRFGENFANPFNWAFNLGLSRKVVVDIDPRNGGLESWAELADQYGDIPITVKDSTKTRGWHWWFEAPAEGLTFPTKVEIAPGIDLKHGKGYVVGPPSLHRCGHPYVWNAAPWDAPFAPLPSWLIDLGHAKSAAARKTMLPAPSCPDQRPTPTATFVPRSVPYLSAEHVMERARRYLAKAGPAISGQNGHNHTYRMACALVRGLELSQHDALTVMAEWSLTCLPPWSDAELRHKIEDADKASGPRGYLLRSDYEYKSTPEEDAAADALIARLRAETEAIIASRPPAPPPEPPQPTVVTPEDAARAIRYSRINCIRNCCPRPEFVGLNILDTGSPYEIERRCGRCPACLAERVQVKWEVIRQKLRAIIDAGGSLYYRVRPAAEWDAVRRQYDRADDIEGKGFFHFKFLPEGFAPDDLAGELPFYLLTSVDIGAPISLGDALCDIRRCLEAAVARVRPRQRLYTASDTWAEARLPRCESKCKFETTLDPIPPADRTEIAAAFDAQIQVKVVPTDVGDTMVQTTYTTIRADGWTDTLRAWYWRCRIAGRVLDEAAFGGSTDAAADHGDVVEDGVVHPSQDSPPRPKIEVDVQLVE